MDQGWALDAIYTVFHREHCLPHLRGDGTFTRRELDRLAWGEVRRQQRSEPFSEDEQELFLSMMVSCGICFAWRKNARGEQVYLAPDMLPPREAVREHLLGRMHESAMGRAAQDAAVYWRNGLWLYEGKSDATR